MTKVMTEVLVSGPLKGASCGEVIVAALKALSMHLSKAKEHDRPREWPTPVQNSIPSPVPHFFKIPIQLCLIGRAVLSETTEVWNSQSVRMAHFQ